MFLFVRSCYQIKLLGSDAAVTLITRLERKQMFPWARRADAGTNVRVLTWRRRGLPQWDSKDT